MLVDNLTVNLCAYYLHSFVCHLHCQDEKFSSRYCLRLLCVLKFEPRVGILLQKNSRV